MPDRRLAWLILAAACTLLAPRPSVAATWQTNGAPLAPTDNMQTSPVVASDGAGGAYVAWQENRNGWGIYGQRLMSDGSIAPGWPASGRLIGAGYLDPVMVADGNRGAFIAGSMRTSVVWWYASSAGVVSPGTPIGILGLRPAPADPADIQKSDPSGLPFLLSDGEGGAYFAWTLGGRLEHYAAVAHITPTGLAPGWGGGVLLGVGAAPVLCSDDSGGVMAAWEPSGIVIRRVLANGTLSPDWPPYSPIPGQSDADAPGLVSDGTGGTLAFWLDRRSGTAQVYAQHFTSKYTIVSGWPADGLRLSQAASDAGIYRYYSGYAMRYSSVAPDGAGGGFVAWSEARGDSSDIYVQHVNPDGALASGWPADGLAVCSAAGTQWLPTIAGDGTGGVLVSWQDHRSGTEWDVYAQHVSGAGALAWPANGVLVCGSGGDQVAPGIVGDGLGGGLLGWQDGRCGTPQIFGSHVLANGSLPGGPEISAIALAPTNATADAGTIGISWQVTKGTLGASSVPVYRRQLDGPWSLAGSAVPNDAGVLTFSDAGQLEGCSYSYALGVVNCGFEQRLGEVAVQTPIGHGFSALAVTQQETHADSGHVRLRWQIDGGKGLQATLSRRDSCSDWVTIGTPVVDETGQILYLDPGPFFVGQHPGYRLVVRACGSDHDMGTIALDPTTTDFNPVPVRFTYAQADTNSAFLSWEEVSGPPSVGHVFRRDSVENWSLRAAVNPRVRLFDYRDTGLLPGHRYEYRLLLTSCEVRAWSDVTALTTATPGSPPVQIEAHPQFGLRAVRPNPASTQLAVDLALENDRPAMLEMLDLSGRRVLLRDVGGLGSGLHSFPLDGIPGLRSGVYLLRLSQDGHSVTRRVTIVH